MLTHVLRSNAGTIVRRHQKVRVLPQSIRTFFSSDSDEKKDELAMEPHVQAVFDSIVKLNMLEIAELSSALQEKFNLPDQNMMMMSAGTNAGAAAEEVKEEKTIFDVKLTSFDAKSKIKIIKEVRVITGLGLKEAKALVEASPSVLKKDMKKDEAEALAAKLKEIGAGVTRQLERSTAANLLLWTLWTRLYCWPRWG